MPDFRVGDAVRVDMSFDTTIHFVNPDGSVDVHRPAGEQDHPYNSILCVPPSFVSLTRTGPGPQPGDVWETPDGKTYVVIRRPTHGTRVILADTGSNYNAIWWTVGEFFKEEPRARRVHSGKES